MGRTGSRAQTWSGRSADRRCQARWAGMPRISAAVRVAVSPGIRAVRVVADAACADGDVGLHELADVGLGEGIVTAKCVLDARRGQDRTRVERREVGGTIGFVVDLAQAAR